MCTSHLVHDRVLRPHRKATLWEGPLGFSLSSASNISCFQHVSFWRLGQCVAQTRRLSQKAEGVQNPFYPKTALLYVEQTWRDTGHREGRESTAASKSVQFCWAQVPAGIRSKPQAHPAVVSLESPPSWWWFLVPGSESELRIRESSFKVGQ